MVPHRKSPLFARWFARQVARRIRRSFSNVHVRGLDRLQAAVDAGPALVVSNHLSWWDPMFAILIGHRLIRADAYALMDAKNLRALPFLGRIGGFGIDLDEPRDGERVIRYTAELLSRPGRLVWIFPQGRERPSTAPIDDFRRGAAAAAALAAVPSVVPLGLRYELRHVPKPEAFIAVGTPLPFDPDVNAGRLAQQNGVVRALGEIDDHIFERVSPDRFESLYESRQRRDGPLERLLALVTRY